MGIKRLTLILCIIVLTGSPVSAEIVLWDLSAPGYWNAAANWNPDKVPAQGDDVIINAGAGVITVDSETVIKTLVLGGTNKVVLSTNKLTINNTLGSVADPTTIDVHLHANISSTSAVPLDLVNLMIANKFSKFIVMDTPMPIYQDPDISSEQNKEFFSAYSSAFRFMYGGSELQPFLYATGHTGTITLEVLYPKGGAGATQADIDQLNAIALNPSTWEATFKARATQAAASGHFVGFGELAPVHLSLKAGQPEMIYNADTPWMLWLSDLAASHNMVLDIHLEVKDDSLTRFATLLSHNSNTRIIWDHAGWCNTGLATADVISVLMAAHPNLYLSLKMRDGANAACSPTDNGNLKSEWYTLLTTYADRIMVGTDAKYWSSTYSLDTELSGSYASLDNMLKQLPADTALKIRNGTAKALFGL